MPKVTEAHIEARRQQILEAARACFSRQGFHQTSIQDICKEAGLSPGAVYRYFPSKDHIIAATCLDCQQGIVDLIEAAKPQGGSPLQTLDFIVDHGINMLNGESSREFTMMNVQLWSEAMRSEEIKNALLMATIDMLGSAFEELFSQAQEQDLVDRELDSRALAITLMGTFHGLVLHKSLDAEIDISACGDAMRAMYQGIFRTTPDAA
jgi:AcrR family transcriptional regulator